MRLATRHRRHVDVHADTAARGGLAGRADEAGAAEVLDTDDHLRVEELEAGLDEALLLVGIADLHARALFGLGLGIAVAPETGRCEHADPTDPVASGRRAEQHREVARAGRAPEHQPVDRQDAHAQDVDQGILCVARVEGELAPDGRHPDRVPVTGDSGHHPFDQPSLACLGRFAEEERVHDRDRPRPHGEDVAEDAPDTGGGSLVGLDGRRVVVALDADGDRDPVARVDHPRVLAGADEDARPLGRQAAEMDPRRLIRTVLAPHDREEGKLEVVGGTTEDCFDLVALLVGEPEGAVEVRVGR